MEEKNSAQLKGKLLERLRDDFRDDSIAAEYTPQEENGIPGGIVAVMFDSMGMSSSDVFGDIFFMPDQDENAEVAYFECALVLTEDLSGADEEALMAALGRLNHTSPVGVFYVDPDADRLLYKLGVPLPADMDEDTLYNEMNIVIGNAVSIVDSSLDELLAITEGA